MIREQEENFLSLLQIGTGGKLLQKACPQYHLWYLQVQLCKPKNKIKTQFNNWQLQILNENFFK